MNKYEDYQNFLKTYDSLLGKLKISNSIVFENYFDLIVAMDHICERAMRNEKIDEETNTFFDLIFIYLSSFLPVLDNIFNEVFKGDIDRFNMYESVIFNYLLIHEYIEFYLSSVKSKKIMNNCNRVEEYLTDVLYNQKDYNIDELRMNEEVITTLFDYSETMPCCLLGHMYREDYSI